MPELYETERFAEWLRSLRDDHARHRVQVRLTRLSLGNAGDVRTVGEGVHELRVHYGPGYRVYFANRGAGTIVLLIGGIKQTQANDIRTAQQLAQDL